MKKLRIVIVIVILAAIAAGVYHALTRPPGALVLTGIIATDEVIVSPEIQGRLDQLLVREGDAVTNGQLLAMIQPQTQQADMAFYANSEQGAAAAVTQAQADLENARLTFEREETLYKAGTDPKETYDEARTAYDSAKAHVDSLNKQTQAASAQTEKAGVMLGYTKIVAPMDAVVDTRAALQGEVVNPGQAIVTLINQDDLWVRVDVEETYIDRIHLGDHLQVRLPSGDVRKGEVYYRSVDADYATQRDVSRTKRDIRTFEVRLRCDNKDRSLAVGMTAYVTLRLDEHGK